MSAESLTAQAVRQDNGRLDLGSLSALMANHGIENTLSERLLSDVPAAAVPFLAVLQDEDAVVVARVEGEGESRRYTVIAPDGSVVVLVAQAVEARYLGWVWFAKARARQDRRSDLPEFTLPSGWLVKVMWRFRGEYAQVALTTIVVNVLALVGSLYAMNVYDRVIPNRSFDTLWALSIGVMIAILFEAAARTIRAQLTDIAGKKADLIISAALFRRVMSLQLVQGPSSAGSYANNLREFESVRDVITSATLLALVDLPFVFLFIAVIFFVAGPLGWIPLATVPLVIIAGVIAQFPLAKYTSESAKESSQRQGMAVEAIEGMETLKSLNASTWAQQQWEHFTATTATSSLKLKNVVTSLTSFTNSVQQLNTVALMLWGTYLIHSPDPDTRITVGALMATVILSGRALAPLAMVTGLMARLNTARVALDGIEKMIERPVDRDPNATYVRQTRRQGHVVLSGVSFAYPGSEKRPTINAVDVQFRPGERVAILGRVGSGKSTLLRVVSGLYAPSQGSVTVDDVNIGQIDPSDLRGTISLMGQSPRLFHGTLRDNIEMAAMDRLLGDDEMMVALKRFGLDTMVRQHPRGLDMEIGEDGRGLSGGQRQLIGLVRVTLRDPKLILLDEPTSGLDQGSEGAVLKALADWSVNRSLVIVTHRPQVLDIVDRIVVVDAGRIILDAPKAEALKKLSQGITPTGAPVADARVFAAPAVSDGAAVIVAPAPPPPNPAKAGVGPVTTRSATVFVGKNLPKGSSQVSTIMVRPGAAAPAPSTAAPESASPAPIVVKPADPKEPE